MSWFLWVSVSMGNKDCISFQTRPMWMLNFVLKPYCRNRFKNADLFCHLASSFNRTAHLHTWQSWPKTGLLPTAVNSLVKMNGLRIRLTTMSGELCLNATCYFNPSQRTSMSSRKFCSWDQLPQDSIKKAILSFLKTSVLCESWWWTLRTYAKMNYLSDFGICNNSQCFLTMKICCWLLCAQLKMWHRIFIQP